MTDTPAKSISTIQNHDIFNQDRFLQYMDDERTRTSQYHRHLCLLFGRTKNSYKTFLYQLLHAKLVMSTVDLVHN